MYGFSFLNYIFDISIFSKSDINLCKQKLAPIEGELELRKEVKAMEEKLDKLKEATEVTHIKKIFTRWMDFKKM